ncbi:MAG: hemolysin family protein [Candidatus Cyclobacteriaceae bacterium M2_1C_046]
MVLLVLYLILAILVSFLCSILEAVLLSITPSYVESVKDSSSGRKLQGLKKDIDRPLAAILSFNTIAHTVGAAGVGAQAAHLWGNNVLGWVSAGLTLLILVFSEIIPKTIGANYWRSLVGFTASTLKILIILMYPLVLLSQEITKILSKNKDQGSVSRAEISAMADIGHKEGIFEKTESKIIKNLIRFRNIKAEDIMTPRTVMIMVQENQPLQDFITKDEFEKFSRIPVFGETRDDITGYVHKHDVLKNLAEDQHEVLLKSIKRDVLMVSEELKLPKLMDRFLEKKDHIAIVTDQYGGIAGLVTMEDVMETLLGTEIIDEFDSEQDMQEFARKKWRSRAIKLGLIEEAEEGSSEKDEVVRYGITGGQAPEEEDDIDRNKK